MHRAEVIDDLYRRYRQGRIARRDFIQAAAALGLGADALRRLVALGADSRAAEPGSAAGPRGPGTPPPPRRGGVMRIASPSATTIDPVKMDSAGSIAIVQQVAEYLVWTEPDLSLRPVLATSWRPDPDARTWRFELRRGTRFHNGRPLTADDVVATFRRLVDPRTASPARSALSFLRPDQIEKVAPYTVRFHLDYPVGHFPYYTQTYNAVILPADHDGDFARNPVGTGPFRLVDYRPQEQAVLARNPDYWDAPRPYLDGVEIRLYENTQAQVLAMQAGAADMMVLTPYLDSLPLFNNPRIRMLSVQTSTHRQLAMRVDRPPFHDRRVREAIALCVDRPALLRGLFNGHAVTGNDHPVAPIYPDFRPIPQRRQDYAAARRLLAEAGYPGGLELDLYTGQHLELPRYAVFLQQMLQPAGIRLRLHVEPLNVYYSHWTEVPLGLTDWTTRPTATQIQRVAFTCGAEWNAAHWCSPEADRLLAQLEAEPDPERRGRLTERIETLLHAEVPAVIAYFTENFRAVQGHVQGVSADLSYFLDLTRAWLDRA